VKNKTVLSDYLMEEFNLTDKMVRSLILRGDVLVNDQPAKSRTVRILSGDRVRIRKQKEYVSRGAYKLLQALEEFKIDVSGRICMDVGSSTGGFTQVLLLSKAEFVYSIDCGTNQLDYSLRNLENVRVFENMRIQDLKKQDLLKPPSFAVMDLSFTSSIPVISYLFEEFSIEELVVLIKPQFEYDYLQQSAGLPEAFDGIVRDETIRQTIICQVKNKIETAGLSVRQLTDCRTPGTKGNRESLFYVEK
jgi:23S rRNA (cytidine1920-2'-O)/16S rRNA (cytidine1409-2'-O)-methyltransferase